MALTIRDRVELAKNGENPLVICRLESCWVTASDPQTIDGYCIILSDPVVPTLNDLSEEARAKYCRDMIRVGDALLKVTGAARINYETWCNLDKSLHTHVVPRFENEPDDKKTKPLVVGYDATQARRFDPVTDRAFVLKMREALKPFALSAKLP